MKMAFPWTAADYVVICVSTPVKKVKSSVLFFAWQTRETISTECMQQIFTVKALLCLFVKALGFYLRNDIVCWVHKESMSSDQLQLKFSYQEEAVQRLLIWRFYQLTQTQTYEIILTLGQAFEVAYQMAVQSRARQYVPPSSLVSEVVETKSSRPVSQSWSGMRRSAVSTTLQTLKDNLVNTRVVCCVFEAEQVLNLLC